MPIVLCTLRALFRSFFKRTCHRGVVGWHNGKFRMRSLRSVSASSAQSGSVDTADKSQSSRHIPCAVHLLSQCHALYKTNLQERRVGFHLAGESLPFWPPERWALRSEVGALPSGECHALSRSKFRERSLRSVSASSAQSGSVSQGSVSAMHFTKHFCKKGGSASI
jgi:hypothetical protein